MQLYVQTPLRTQAPKKWVKNVNVLPLPVPSPHTDTPHTPKVCHSPHVML